MDKKLFNRVDFQVAVLVVGMIALTGIIVFNVVYYMSYREMIRMLENDVHLLTEYIDESLNSEIFSEIKTADDMATEEYVVAHNLLNKIRGLSDTKYLYTAIKNDAGDLIYHIDGLSHDDPDFRNVGDLIEPEFREPLLRALNAEIVIPNDIMTTEWGNVFVAYYPIHDEKNNVVAALGIEFFADNQYEAYQNIRLAINIVVAILCTISGYIARALFRRFINPHFKDMYNTDSLTQLKNRNAFDADTYNFIQAGNLNGVCLVITDLNGLKPINDKFGHKMGDFYINSCAKSLIVDNMDYCIVYRIGGDEFATIIPAKYSANSESYIQSVQKNLKNICAESLPTASVSMGCAVCNGTTLADWEEAYKNADEAMYLAKKMHYKTNSAHDERR